MQMKEQRHRKILELIREFEIGTQEELADRLKKMGILNLYACIGYPQVEDEYLTKNSAEFHAHLGFELVGTFHNCGYKFDRWYDMVWMEKIIGEPHAGQPAVKPYSEVKE